MTQIFKNVLLQSKIPQPIKMVLLILCLNFAAIGIIFIVFWGLHVSQAKTLDVYVWFGIIAAILSAILIQCGVVLVMRFTAPFLKSVAESEMKYRSFVDMASDAIIVLDAENFQILEVNQMAAQWLKMTQSELQSKKISDLHPAESWPLYDQAIKRFIKEQKLPRENVILFKTKEGQIIPAEVNASILTIQKKRIIFSVFRDLRDRQFYQEDLRVREQLLSMVISNIPYYVFWKDQNSVFQGCNQNFANLFGLKDPQEIIGKDDFSLPVKRSEAEYYRSVDQEVMTNKQEIIEFEETLRDSAGQDRIILTSKVPLKKLNGEVIGILGIFKDITEQKQNENQLRILSQAVEQSASSIVITDIHGAIQYVNRRFVETTGYSVSELVGQNPRILKSGQQRPAFYEQLWTTILSGRQWRGMFKNKKKNGDLYWELATISPIRDEHGKIFAFVGVKDDITHDKELHRVLSRMQDQLIHAEKMAAIGQLSSGFAHEIKNPLAIIMLSADELTTLDDGKNTSVEFHLRLIREAAQRADDVIRQLLDYSRAQSGELTETDLKMVVQRSIDLVKAGSKSKMIDFKFETEVHHPFVLGDFVALQEVFVNLLTNAVDALSEQGIIEVRIFMDPDTYHKDQKRILIDVWDNGSGIPQDQLTKIFEPFYTTKESGKGTGLGLNTVYNIVNKHQGSVWVNSTIGIGTTFTVALPLLKKL